MSTAAEGVALNEEWFASLKQDEFYREDIGGGITVMDDHQWALLAWERCRANYAAGTRFTLLHADHHFDDQDNISPDLAPANLEHLGIDELEGLIRKAHIPDEVPARPFVNYNSFIYPAVARGYVRQLHFFCTENEREGADSIFEEHRASEFDCEVTLHSEVATFAAAEQRPLLFDLCLDLFNDAADAAEGVDLWPREKIVAFIEACDDRIRAASVVTVSLSFGFSGQPDDTRNLARLVLPRLLAMRS